MVDMKSINAEGTNGSYNVCYRNDKPDVITISWNDTCIGMMKLDVDTREKFLDELKSGKKFDDAWKEHISESEPLDSLIPMTPYAVFIKKKGEVSSSESYTTLEQAQEAALEYLEKHDEDATAFVCFITGRYYRDGTVTCLNNIYSKGQPDLKIPFAKVLGMDMGVFEILFKDKANKA